MIYALAGKDLENKKISMNLFHHLLSHHHKILRPILFESHFKSSVIFGRSHAGNFYLRAQFIGIHLAHSVWTKAANYVLFVSLAGHKAWEGCYWGEPEKTSIIIRVTGSAIA